MVSYNLYHRLADESTPINVEIFIDPQQVAGLNNGSCTLSTIAVLRLIGGKDFFVSVMGQFVPTCFGMPLGVLLSLRTTPVGLVPIEELRDKVRRIVSPSFVSALQEHTHTHTLLCQGDSFVGDTFRSEQTVCVTPILALSSSR